MKRMALLLAICVAAMLLFALPAQAQVELSGGAMVFLSGPAVSISGTVSQPIASVGEVEFSANLWFLATPGDVSQMAGGVAAKIKSDGKLQVGVGYAHGRNTTELSLNNVGITALYDVAALVKPAALAPGELPDRELKVGLLENGLVGVRWTRRF